MTQLLMKDIKLPFTVPAEEAIGAAKRKLKKILREQDIAGAGIYRRSTDARKREDICFVYSILVETHLPASAFRQEALAKLGCSLMSEEELPAEPSGSEEMGGRPVIVGFGPCGMFCAMLLAEYGYRPIVLERGGDVEDRVKAVEKFYAEGILDEECNIQFGAGGAGTFSDGKLVTRINDGKCRYVLERLHELGADVHRGEVLVRRRYRWEGRDVRTEPRGHGHRALRRFRDRLLRAPFPAFPPHAADRRAPCRRWSAADKRR